MANQDRNQGLISEQLWYDSLRDRDDGEFARPKTSHIKNASNVDRIREKVLNQTGKSQLNIPFNSTSRMYSAVGGRSKGLRRSMNSGIR